jgi:zinc/manganese transport system substrate-binding protein
MTRVLLALIAVLALCQPALAQKLKVVATFSIIGDTVERVAGDKVELTTLVDPDADGHVFEPTPADARAMAGAQIVFANGLGFEPWLDRLMKSTRARAKVVTVSQGVRVRAFKLGGASDPHAWQDAHNAAAYVGNVTLALAAADPANAVKYRAAGADYINEINALNREISLAFAKIPNADRRVITSHDAFGYFAAAYVVEFIAPLGISTEEQPSAKGVARLIEQIKREKIRAVFVENISDPRLIEQIARETGAKIGGKLYSDALSTKAGPAPTYIAMMRHNVRLLTAAMAPGL